MLTIKNINSILNTKYGNIGEWELIDIRIDECYHFTFRKFIPGAHTISQKIKLERDGAYNGHVGKLVYKFGVGIYTLEYLENKNNVKDIFEARLK